MLLVSITPEILEPRWWNGAILAKQKRAKGTSTEMLLGDENDDGKNSSHGNCNWAVASGFGADLRRQASSWLRYHEPNDT